MFVNPLDKPIGHSNVLVSNVHEEINIVVYNVIPILNKQGAT